MIAVNSPETTSKSTLSSAVTTVTAPPIRSVHSAEGWTPEKIAEIALPALRPSFMPLDRSGEVLSWDPV